MEPKSLVDRIIHSDKHIRFAAICNMDSEIVHSVNREGVTNILSEDETEESVKRAVNSWKSRSELFSKTGQGKYALVVYEKLKRVTMPVDQNHLIYLTFDSDGNNTDVIQSVLNLKPGADTAGLSS